MTFDLKSLAVVGVLALASVNPLAAQARGQGPQGRGRGPQRDAGGVAPGDVQKMFDAYALMQAQEQLEIDDAHFTRFLTAFKALQDVRRQGQQERTRVIVELRRLSNADGADDARIKDRLKALQDIETRTAADVKKAYDAIDELLDVRQQAKFRAFEELMERRKLELVLRARQGNRQPRF